MWIGEKAGSSKRVLKGYPYTNHTICDVLLETKEMINIDIQIKFNMGRELFVIDTQKIQSDRLKDLYKAFVHLLKSV